MSTVLYYFSATGNSLHVAKSIAAGLNDCSIMSIPSLREKPEVIAEAQSVGLVFPLHYFGLSPLINQFVGKLKLTSAPYVFAAVTCGDPHFSSAFRQLNKLLAAKGSRLNAGLHVKMISNYIPLSKIPDPHKQQKVLRNADKKIAAIIDIINTRQQVIEPEYLWAPALLINNYWKKGVASADIKFYNTADCIACGKCEKFCPVDNIKLDDGKPQWQHNCLECLACLHFCPVSSINFGSRTSGRQKYHHPQTTSQEIMAEMKIY